MPIARAVRTTSKSGGMVRVRPTMSASGTAVFYLSQRTANAPPSLRMFNLESRKEDTILDGVAGYDLSADGKKIIYRQRDNTYGVIDAHGGAKAGDGKLDLEKLTLRVQPRDGPGQVLLGLLAKPAQRAQGVAVNGRPQVVDPRPGRRAPRRGLLPRPETGRRLEAWVSIARV